MADAHARLRERVRRLESLAGVTQRVAPAVAVALRDEVARTADAGQAPSGTAWKPREDGAQALRGVSARITARAVGDVVSLSLEDHLARHDRGWVRGGVRRQVLPRRTELGLVSDAIDRVVMRALRDSLVRGGAA